MSDERAGDFSLITEPWVLVQRRDDRIGEVSLREALVNSPEFVRLRGDLPTQAFAILRVMLAVLHRAVGGPRDIEHWLELWRSGPPVDEIDTYFKAVGHRFWLFDPREPFFQVPDLRSDKGLVSGLDRLIAEIPPKDPFFTVRLDEGVDHITAAEAARWLVHCQAFDASGIKTGAVGDPRVKGGKGYPIGVAWAGNLGCLIAEGTTLWETLLLNLIPEDVAERVNLLTYPEDVPVWERAELPGPAEDPCIAQRPYGPLDLYTWQSRRIRLFGDRDGVTGVIVANGDRLKPQGDATRPLDTFTQEPMSGWRRSTPQQKLLKREVVYMPQEHRLERALWRGLGSLLPRMAPRGKGGQPPDFQTSAVIDWLAILAESVEARQRLELASLIRIHALGFVYGSNSSVFDAMVDDRVDVDLQLLSSASEEQQQAVQEAINRAERGANAVAFLAGNLERAAGGVDKNGGEGARLAATEEAYRRLGFEFQDWLVTVAGRPRQEILDDWELRANAVLSQLGWHLATNAGQAAAIGRDVPVAGGNTMHMSTAEASLIFTGQLRSIFEAAYDTAPVQIKEETA